MRLSVLNPTDQLITSGLPVSVPQCEPLIYRKVLEPLRPPAPYGLEIIESCVKCPHREERLFCNLPETAVNRLAEITFSATYLRGPLCSWKVSQRGVHQILSDLTYSKLYELPELPNFCLTGHPAA
jgi:hypothetical protein